MVVAVVVEVLDIDAPVVIRVVAARIIPIETVA